MSGNGVEHTRRCWIDGAARPAGSLKPQRIQVEGPKIESILRRHHQQDYVQQGASE